MRAENFYIAIYHKETETVSFPYFVAVSYTHLRAHETVLDIVCRLLLEKKKQVVYTTMTC